MNVCGGMFVAGALFGLAGVGFALWVERLVRIGREIKRGRA